MSKERAIKRKSERPLDRSTIPLGMVTLDDIKVEAWISGDDEWKWPESFGRIEVWLERPPRDWQAGTTRWFRLAWIEDDGSWAGGRYEQDFEARITASCGAVVHLLVKRVA